MLLCLLRTWDISWNYSVVSGQLKMTVSGVTLLNIMITEGPTQVREPVTGMCPSQRRLRAKWTGLLPACGRSPDARW